MQPKLGLSSAFRTLIAFPRVPAYSYKPLSIAPDAIRLVLVQPAPFFVSPICCRMIETSWTHEEGGTTFDRGYVSLSYCWGDTIRDIPIEIDGRQFYITRNLELALRYLRLQRKELRLWADSICVDQDNIKERNWHVMHMRSIYSAARETTLFLGDSTKESDTLINAIKDSKIRFSPTTTKANVIKSLTKSSGLSKSDLEVKVLDLLRRPYWRRIWVFQEILVSPNPWIQCGNMKITWDAFCRALLSFIDSSANHSGSGSSNDPKRRLENIYWERVSYSYKYDRPHTRTIPLTLLALLVSKRGLEATDPRDMVFAVSGIARRPEEQDPVRFTYEKSTSLVYMRYETLTLVFMRLISDLVL